MTVEFRAGEQAPAPVKLIHNLDGSASRNTVAGRNGSGLTEQTSKVAWAANTLVVTKTTSAGDEKRTFSTQGDHLVVETSAPTRPGGAAAITRVT